MGRRAGFRRIGLRVPSFRLGLLARLIGLSSGIAGSGIAGLCLGLAACRFLNADVTFLFIAALLRALLAALLGACNLLLSLHLAIPGVTLEGTDLRLCAAGFAALFVAGICHLSYEIYLPTSQGLQQLQPHQLRCKH